MRATALTASFVVFAFVGISSCGGDDNAVVKATAARTTSPSPAGGDKEKQRVAVTPNLHAGSDCASMHRALAAARSKVENDSPLNHLDSEALWVHGTFDEGSLSVMLHDPSVENLQRLVDACRADGFKAP
jgi:hypothetical protein